MSDEEPPSYAESFAQYSTIIAVVQRFKYVYIDNQQQCHLGPQIDQDNTIALLSTTTSYAKFLIHQFEAYVHGSAWSEEEVNDMSLPFIATLRITQCEDGLITDVKVDNYNWLAVRRALIHGMGPNTRVNVFIGMSALISEPISRVLTCDSNFTDGFSLDRSCS
ncbi:hypothetical protein CLAFUW4_02646 [Fulvia fulva]|uniref:Uncharacterized protein n=1 Tax=Passalora fulva TaxID=5499 RepID=A0A9Q8LBJ8_PASFU|nr:uncharacterized protein CLAFUR5_02636 [Fulvia fulva]KAK4632172.1 hypothetical protein CLAFUR4_02641 [Fulvia fulva]KAK4632973.1 hypothetical protein CLAFUR0_02643 [Fulvia fulva]UJO14350.1 hypothetical protein CLAFUR5_02636 [Fulvia fulva]WPV11629.1 hypothetical protein CLAFUW4_02646 [Fulvia fulva]WPV25456.1 hypothetical protein CLAFUW7_02646 [Fulvia fulva]